MENLMDLLKNQVSDGLVEQLSRQLGGVEKEKTSTAMDSAMTMIMGALSKNASKPEGASALASALDRDHDGSILDDVVGFLGGAKQPQNKKMLNGEGILKHVLGGKQESAVEMISKNSGMEKSKTSQLLATVAPILMGMLGKVKREQNLDQRGLTDFLQSSTKEVVRKKPEAQNILTSILDRDGDGSIMDDVAESGIKSLFGKLFK